MSLTKFFDVISRFVPGSPFMGGDPVEIAKLNPEKFYVENVRVALHTTEWQARLYCDTAVRQGVLDRFVEAIAPDDAVAASAPTKAELRGTVSRWVERNGELNEEVLQLAELPTRTFYRLHR